MSLISVSREISNFSYILVLSAAMLSVNGCSLGPDFAPPSTALGDAQFAGREEYFDDSLSAEPPPRDWWWLFNDNILVELEGVASKTNLGLLVATERIEQSRAELGITTAQIYPVLSSSGSYSRERLSDNGRLAALGALPGPTDYWKLGLDSSWEIDLWGRAKRSRESAAARLEESVHDRNSVLISIQAEVARTYLNLRGVQAQLRIAQDNARIARRILDIALSREKNGVSTQFETATARSELARVDELIPSLSQQINASINALALLIGQPPRTLNNLLTDALPLPALPSKIPVGIPSELAKRRSDILRAEAALHAETALIGVAKADFYPRVSLNGRFGVEAFESGALMGWDSRSFSIGPSIYLPLFEGGRLVNRLKLSEARQRSAALTYRKTVLEAWHEIENLFNLLGALRRRHVELVTANAADRRALRAAQRGFERGATDYLSVLTAQRNVLESQSRLNSSVTETNINLVNLYKSLGGGWGADVTTEMANLARLTHFDTEDYEVRDVKTGQANRSPTK